MNELKDLQGVPSVTLQPDVADAIGAKILSLLICYGVTDSGGERPAACECSGGRTQRLSSVWRTLGPVISPVICQSAVTDVAIEDIEPAVLRRLVA